MGTNAKFCEQVSTHRIEMVDTHKDHEDEIGLPTAVLEQSGSDHDDQEYLQEG